MIFPRAGLSPYLLMPKMYHRQQSHDQTNKWMHLETTKEEEEEEEMKLESQTTALTSFIGNRSVLTGNSVEQEATRFGVKGPRLHFDVVKNGNVGTHALT